MPEFKFEVRHVPNNSFQRTVRSGRFRSVKPQENVRPAWPLIVSTVVWSFVVVFMGLPLTGGGHGPLQLVIVVALAPFVFPIGLSLLTVSTFSEATGCLLSCILVYAGAADFAIARMLISNREDILEIGTEMLWYLAVWLLLWFGGQLVLGSFALRWWRANRLRKNT